MVYMYHFLVNKLNMLSIRLKQRYKDEQMNISGIALQVRLFTSALIEIQIMPFLRVRAFVPSARTIERLRRMRTPPFFF